MTHELTHEQVAVLRYFALASSPVSIYKELLVLRAARYLNGTHDGGDLINVRGIEALARYDREWVTVSRADVSELVGGYGAVAFSARFRVRAALEGK